jgi:hypothetical protein
MMQHIHGACTYIAFGCKGASPRTDRDGLSAYRSNEYQPYILTWVFSCAVAAFIAAVPLGTYLRASDGMQGSAEASATCRAELTAMHNVNAG